MCGFISRRGAEAQRECGGLCCVLLNCNLQLTTYNLRFTVNCQLTSEIGVAVFLCRVYTEIKVEDYMKRYFIYALILVGLLCNGCFKLKTEHKVEPIHITMDINLKVQRDLEEFLDVE